MLIKIFIFVIIPSWAINLYLIFSNVCQNQFNTKIEVWISVRKGETMKKYKYPKVHIFLYVTDALVLFMMLIINKTKTHTIGQSTVKTNVVLSLYFLFVITFLLYFYVPTIIEKLFKGNNEAEKERIISKSTFIIGATKTLVLLLILAMVAFN